jgi:hypothetical protein
MRRGAVSEGKSEHRAPNIEHETPDGFSISFFQLKLDVHSFLFLD